MRLESALVVMIRYTRDVNELFLRLNRFHGITEATASARLHGLKGDLGLPADMDLLFDLTGNVYVPSSFEHLGSLTQGGGP